MNDGRLSDPLRVVADWDSSEDIAQKVAAAQHEATRAVYGLAVRCTHDKEQAWDVPGVQARCEDCNGTGKRWWTAREVAAAFQREAHERGPSSTGAWLEATTALKPILAALQATATGEARGDHGAREASG